MQLPNPFLFPPEGGPGLQSLTFMPSVKFCEQCQSLLLSIEPRGAAGGLCGQSGSLAGQSS